MEAKERENTSGIRNWVRKHSPLKSRNKPLPIPPLERDASPLKEISHNRVANRTSYPSPTKVCAPSNDLGASPTKPARRDEKDAKPAKLTRLLKASKDKEKQRSASAPIPHNVDEFNRVYMDGFDVDDMFGPARHSASTTTVNQPRPRIAKAPRPQPARQSSNPDDINLLSKRVTSLEQQLREARRELHAFRGDDEVENQENARSRRETSPDIERRMQEKVNQLSQRGRYNGLVENLLGEPSRALQPSLRSSSNTQIRETGTRQRSASERRTEYKVSDAEAYAGHHKRKASEREARSASWHVDNNIYEGVAAVHQQETKRLRREGKANKELPPPPPESPREVMARRAQPSIRNITQEDESHTVQEPKRRRRTQTTPSSSREPSTYPEQLGRSLNRSPTKQQPVEEEPNWTEEEHADEEETCMKYDSDDAFGQPRKGNRVSRHRRRTSVDYTAEPDEEMETLQKKHHPPSPTRRHVPSPSRLARVEEEFEWDEDIF